MISRRKREPPRATVLFLLGFLIMLLVDAAPAHAAAQIDLEVPASLDCLIDEDCSITAPGLTVVNHSPMPVRLSDARFLAAQSDHGDGISLSIGYQDAAMAENDHQEDPEGIWVEREPLVLDGASSVSLDVMVHARPERQDELVRAAAQQEVQLGTIRLTFAQIEPIVATFSSGGTLYFSDGYPDDGQIADGFVRDQWEFYPCRAMSESEVPWRAYGEHIASVVALEPIEPLYTANWFSGCSRLESVDLAKLTTAQTLDTSNMFKNCSALGAIDMGTWDTASVRDATGMFSGCTDLEFITIGDAFTLAGSFPSHTEQEMPHADGGWYALSTEKRYMPSTIPQRAADTYCAVLPALFTYYPTGTVIITRGRPTGQEAASAGCAYGTEAYQSRIPEFGRHTDLLDGDGAVPWFSMVSDTTINPSRVLIVDTIYPTTLFRFFREMYRVSQLDVSRIDTTYCTTARGAFYDMVNLESIVGISSWNVSNISDISYLFGMCSFLQTIDLTSWRTSSLEDMSYLFYGCNELSSIEGIGSFDVTHVIDAAYCFSDFGYVSTLDLSGWDTRNCPREGFESFIQPTYFLDEVYIGKNFTFTDILERWGVPFAILDHPETAQANGLLAAPISAQGVLHEAFDDASASSEALSVPSSSFKAVASNELASGSSSSEDDVSCPDAGPDVDPREPTT